MIVESRFPFVKVAKASVVTIGMFDGVHEGHQKILRAVVGDACRLKAESVVFTFEQHPQTVVGRINYLPMVTTLDQRLALLKRLGIGCTVLASFDRSFSRIDPEAFVKHFLLQRARMKELCVGYDFAFGRNRSGDIRLLKELSRQCGFRLRIFAPVRRCAMAVSSTLVRKLLQKAKLEMCRKLLGRFYSMEGIVKRGRGLGKILGFPTANIRMKNDVLLPNGVYAVFARGIGPIARPGVLNVGIRPTLSAANALDLSSKNRTWELHLWNFRNDLYDKPLEIYFVKRLRSERKFKSPVALSVQIGKDVRRAKAVLASCNKAYCN